MSAKIFIDKYIKQFKAMNPKYDVIYTVKKHSPIKFEDSENVRLSMAIIADTHLPNRESAEKNLQNTFEDLSNSEEKFDAFLIAGDIADYGTDNEYDRFFRGDALQADSAERSIPDRGSIADLYRGLRDRNGHSGDLDSLYLRLRSDKTNYCTFRIGMDVLMERGLVARTRDKGGWRFTLPVMKQKVDLNDSPIMQKLYLIKGQNGC